MATLKKPQLPKYLTPESGAAYKSAMRVYDAERIRHGIATPWEVQIQNSAVPLSSPLPMTFKSVVPAAVLRMEKDGHVGE